MTMPIFGAGQRVTGAMLRALADAIDDINEILNYDSWSVDDTTLRTTTSAAYTTTLSPANILGTPFSAPPSGIVLILWGCRLNNSATNFTAAAIQVASGSTPGSGATFLAADDNRAVTTDGNIFEGQSRATRVTGLTAGGSYNVAMYHRTAGGTGSFTARDIQVIPLTS